MAFGALVAFAVDGPLHQSMIVAALAGMAATAALSLVLDVVLWQPLRVRRAGFMSLFLASIGLALVLRQSLLLALTTWGRVLRAMADDRALAAVAGIDVARATRVAWLMSGLLAGLAGVLAAMVEYSFDPNFGFQLLLPVFAAVVLGGIGSAYGALAGGLVLGIAQEVSTWSGFAGGVNPVYKPVVAFGVLAAALLIRPQGFFGRARIA